MRWNSLKTVTLIGFSRGLIELRLNLTTIINYIFFPTVALFVMYALRGYSVDDTGMSLGVYAIPGIISMNVLFTGLMGIASTLMLEREDGTLLRARAIPNGTIGYFIGKIVSQTLLTVVTFGVVLFVAAALFDGLLPNLLSGIITLIVILPLGILAMLPIGIVLGSLLKHPRQLSIVSLLLMGMTAISGVFYPLALQAPVLQFLGQLFPLYWLGLGMRSAMLPGEVIATEIDQSWRSIETVAVLGTWAVVASLLALYALRKISHRSSGSRRGRRFSQLIRRSPATADAA